VGTTQTKNENLALLLRITVFSAFFLCGFTAVCSSANLVGVLALLIYCSLIVNMSFFEILLISKLSFFNCCRYVISEVLPLRQLHPLLHLRLKLQRSSEKENKIFLKIGLTISEQASSLKEKKCLGRRKTPPAGPVCNNYYLCKDSMNISMYQKRRSVSLPRNINSRRG
jgi:hypothetical protein